MTGEKGPVTELELGTYTLYIAELQPQAIELGRWFFFPCHLPSVDSTEAIYNNTLCALRKTIYIHLCTHLSIYNPISAVCIKAMTIRDELYIIISCPIWL